VPGGWFDLHLHTAGGSEDSRLDPWAAAERLKALGFAGFAVTDHQTAGSAAAVRALAEATGLVVLRGAEVTTEVGHVLVLGWDDEGLWRYHTLAELAEAARRKGAVVIVAHPLRAWHSRRAQGAGVGPPDLEALAQSSFWQWADGVEADNGRATEAENRGSRWLAARLGRLATGGSDAHALAEVGRSGTWIEAERLDAESVLDALRQGRAWPGRPAESAGPMAWAPT
jgi:predicted metal-dependent phosphoesterase TrpH